MIFEYNIQLLIFFFVFQISYIRKVGSNELLPSTNTKSRILNSTTPLLLQGNNAAKSVGSVKLDLLKQLPNAKVVPASSQGNAKNQFNLLASSPHGFAVTPGGLSPLGKSKLDQLGPEFSKYRVVVTTQSNI